jgi:endonuclease YncB( thermonuclease family)
MSVKRVNGLAVPTPPLAHRYVMDAALISVHDGDTATLRLRLPFREAYEGRCRFARINCPELTAPGGPEARDFAAAWFAEAMAATLPAVERDYPLLVQGRNGDNYGRPLLEIFRKCDGHNISDDILAAGHAKPYALTIWQEYRR